MGEFEASGMLKSQALVSKATRGSGQEVKASLTWANLPRLLKPQLCSLHVQKPWRENVHKNPSASLPPYHMGLGLQPQR